MQDLRCKFEMNLKDWEQDFYGRNARISTREEDCVIYRNSDESGEAVLTRFDVYPGISLVYNDVHMPKIALDIQQSYHNILEINHCREGRIEFESAEGEYLYVKKGDMAINTKAGVKSYSNFPQSHYHGVTIEIDLDVLKKKPLPLMVDMGINLERMEQNFCKKNRCLVLHEKEEFEHLFTELYLVPDKIRIRYYKLKIMEILFFLSAIDLTQEHIEKRYFNKDLVAHVKEMHEYMIDHLADKLTIDFLAEKFQITPTRLKKCFHEVYGNSVYAYLKEARIHKASELLKDSNLDIGTIAGMVGYDNASKFSGSFKSIMGINPNEFRKNI